MKKLPLILLCLFVYQFQIQAQYFVRISEPSSIAGKYQMARAAFGGAWKDTISGSLALANNGAGSTTACDTIVGVAGKIAFIDRGNCDFVDKVGRAERNGAIAVIVCNNATTGFTAAFPFGPKISNAKIPVGMLSKTDCDKIKVSIGNAKAQIYFENVQVPATVLWSEDFSKRLTGWTTKGLRGVIDTFEWEPRGITNGIARSELQSPTCENGVVLFDADWKTSKGDINNVPAQQPYTNHYGELVSPTINCTDFKNVRMRFFQHFAPLNSGNSNGNASSSYISFSYDGGTTWPDSTELNADVEPNDETDAADVINLDLPKFDGKSQCKFRFRFNGDFYSWMIDDIQLISRTAVDLVMTENFFFPFNYSTPASQITTDTSTFSAEVTNFGSLAVGNAIMKVQIKNPTGAIIHRDSVVLANIPANNADSLFINFPKFFVPGKLAKGLYTLTYFIDAPAGATDGNLKDNKIEQVFVVSDDLFSKHDNNENSRGRQYQANYQLANMYFTSTDWNANDKFKAMDVDFGGFTLGGEKLAGKSVTLYLARFSDKVTASLNNWDLTKGITNNKDQLELVGLATYDFKGETSERAKATLQDFTTFTDGVDLKKSSRYLLAASYTDAANKILHYLELDYFYDFGTFIFADGQWQLGGFAPELSLRLAISTPTDEIALPDNSLQLYPNPATDYIRSSVQFDKPTDVNFTITDIQGRVLQFHSKKGALKDNYEFDVRNFVPGTYMMRISTNDGTKTKKFVVK